MAGKQARMYYFCEPGQAAACLGYYVTRSSSGSLRV